MSSVDTASKVMFEIYRERGYNRAYRVVYFTELSEHNREHEINQAMAGEHFLDGFFAEKDRDAARAHIDELITRLNDGTALSEDEARLALQTFLVE